MYCNTHYLPACYICICVLRMYVHTYQPWSVTASWTRGAPARARTVASPRTKARFRLFASLPPPPIVTQLHTRAASERLRETGGVQGVRLMLKLQPSTTSAVYMPPPPPPPQQRQRRQQQARNVKPRTRPAAPDSLVTLCDKLVELVPGYIDTTHILRSNSKPWPGF
jgi:hypothetical protein